MEPRGRESGALASLDPELRNGRDALFWPQNMGTEAIDDYLRPLPEDQRRALERLRRTIQKAAPRAEECISYRLPAFRLDGPLVAFGAAARHCSFYPMSASTVAEFAEALKDFDTSKGAIRFQPDHPLPAALVRKIVKARIQANRRKRADAAES